MPARRLARALPFAVLVALATFAIFTWGWRDGGSSERDRERAKARTWAQVLALTGEDGRVLRLDRDAPFLWSVVIQKPAGTVCFMMNVDPARDDAPAFEQGTVAQIDCDAAAGEL